jgi:hypothetical protein
MTRRTPSAILEAKGAFTKNPSRKREDFQAGDFDKTPPEYFNAAQVSVWDEIVSLLPDGVLQATDRMALELVSRLVATFRATDDANVTMAQIAQLRTTLATLGMTPADRSRVTAIKKPGVNPFLALVGKK